MLRIKDTPSGPTVAQLREQFEAEIKTAKAIVGELSLEPVEVDGSFSHYQDPHTDGVWVGFALSRQITPERCAATNKRIPVTIKWSPTGGHWYLCHAESEQNAFRAEVNRFDTPAQAAEAARDRGCRVVRVNANCGKTCGAPCVECLPEGSTLKLATLAKHVAA